MRELSPTEDALLTWVLPADRAGYREILDRIRGWIVIATGRRGEGHLILAPRGTNVDHDSPLPQVFAYGEVGFEEGECIVTVREPLGDQLDVEIMGFRPGPERYRWTFSNWSPGDACPRCGHPVREVRARTAGGNQLSIVFCAHDARMWVYEERTRVNHPVPLTLYYSELMRRMGIKHPSVALDGSRLFSHLDTFSDTDLLRGFASYNDIRSKVPVDDRIIIPEASKGFLARLLSTFRRDQ